MPTDELPRKSVKQETWDEINHHYDIIEQELPGVKFAPSVRKARVNLSIIQAMISDKLDEETLRRALRNLSDWEKQNFRLPVFYEQWMPAKLARMPATNGASRQSPPPANGLKDFTGIGRQLREAQARGKR